MWAEQCEGEQAGSLPQGRLKAFAQRWVAEFGDRLSEKFRRTLQRGLWMRLRSRKSVPKMQRRHSITHYVEDPRDLAWAIEELQALVDSGALVPCNRRKVFCHPFFVVHQKDKRRLVLDLRRLNKLVLESATIQYDDLRKIAAELKPGAWIWSADLKSAYHHVSLSTAFSKMVGVVIPGMGAFRWTVLPFGYSAAPKIFQSLMMLVAQAIGEVTGGLVRVFVYLDDLLFTAPPSCSAEEANALVRLSVDTVRALGLLINFKKSVLYPSKELRHLGLVINSQEMVFKIPDDKKNDLRNFANLLEQKEEVRAKTLSKMMGKLESVNRAFSPAKAYTWNLVRDVKKARGRWNEKVRLSESTREDLAWIASNITSALPRAIRPPRRRKQLFTDASLLGWGAYCPALPLLLREAWGLWNDLPAPGSDCWTPSEEHIMVLEMRAVSNAIVAFNFRDTAVQVFTDNQNVLAYLKKWGGSGSKELLAETRRLWRICWERSVTLIEPQWISTKHNVVADRLSRIAYSWRPSTASPPPPGRHIIDLGVDSSNGPSDSSRREATERC